MALAVAAAAMWLRSRRLALTANAMAAATVVVGGVAHGDTAVSLQLLAFGCLLGFASRAEVA